MAKFGMREIQDFLRTCTDPRVLAIGRRMTEARSKNARWCQRVAQMEAENVALRERCERLEVVLLECYRALPEACVGDLTTLAIDEIDRVCQRVADAAQRAVRDE